MENLYSSEQRILLKRVEDKLGHSLHIFSFFILSIQPFHINKIIEFFLMVEWFSSLPLRITTILKHLLMLLIRQQMYCSYVPVLRLAQPSMAQQPPACLYPSIHCPFRHSISQKS